VILAPPVAAAVRDMFVYAYGRLDEPPRPAGLLPGEPLRKADQAGQDHGLAANDEHTSRRRRPRRT
jgi:hypothetical protein